MLNDVHGATCTQPSANRSFHFGTNMTESYGAYCTQCIYMGLCAVRRGQFHNHVIKNLNYDVKEYEKIKFIA